MPAATIQSLYAGLVLALFWDLWCLASGEDVDASLASPMIAYGSRLSETVLSNSAFSYMYEYLPRNQASRVVTKFNFSIFSFFMGPAVLLIPKCN